VKKTLLLPVLLCLSHHAAADDRVWIPYKKLLETTYLDKFYAAPASRRDLVAMAPVIAPVNKNIKAADVVLTVAHAGGKQAMPVNADGRVDFVYNQKWLDEGATIMINQPKGEKMGIGFRLDAIMPEGLQWKYATLMGSVRQSNELIKSQAGMLSMFAPTMKAVILKFARPAQLKIQAKSGVTTLASDAKGAIRLAPDDALMQENPLMVLSERPTEAELD
jgi:hypothetical protein